MAWSGQFVHQSFPVRAYGHTISAKIDGKFHFRFIIFHWIWFFFKFSFIFLIETFSQQYLNFCFVINFRFFVCNFRRKWSEDTFHLDVLQMKTKQFCKILVAKRTSQETICTKILMNQGRRRIIIWKPCLWLGLQTTHSPKQQTYKHVRNLLLHLYHPT